MAIERETKETKIIRFTTTDLVKALAVITTEDSIVRLYAGREGKGTELYLGPEEFQFELEVKTVTKKPKGIRVNDLVYYKNTKDICKVLGFYQMCSGQRVRKRYPSKVEVLKDHIVLIQKCEDWHKEKFVNIEDLTLVKG